MPSLHFIELSYAHSRTLVTVLSPLRYPADHTIYGLAMDTLASRLIFYFNLIIWRFLHPGFYLLTAYDSYFLLTCSNRSNLNHDIGLICSFSITPFSVLSYSNFCTDLLPGFFHTNLVPSFIDRLWSVCFHIFPLLDTVTSSMSLFDVIDAASIKAPECFLNLI